MRRVTENLRCAHQMAAVFLSYTEGKIPHIPLVGVTVAIHTLLTVLEANTVT